MIRPYHHIGRKYEKFMQLFKISISFIFQLSSQHPYAEKFVGESLVYTINIWNKTEVTTTMKTILNKTVRKDCYK